MVGNPLPQGKVSWSKPPPSNIRPGDPLLVISAGDHWRPVQTCSFALRQSPPPPIRVTSGDSH